MPKFFTPYGDRPPRSPCECGSEYANTYHIECNQDGVKLLKNDGQTNVYERIQASLEETKIENIVAKAMATGQMDKLAAQEDRYLDVSCMPTSLTDALNKINYINQQFDAMPMAVREAYEFNPERFLADYGSEHWAEIVGLKQPEREVVTNGDDPQQ